MNKILMTFFERREELFKALGEHIQISFLSLVIALIIAVPLGIYLSYHKKVAEIVIGITAVLQTVPSLALLGLLIPFVGIGTTPAIIALVIYALLPILRNTYTGIGGVDPVYLLASKAMGMNKFQQLFKVQLPLAMPVIMAGIRTATVLIIGTATLASLIGAGGLGNLILLGLDRNNNSLILLGAIPAAFLAVLFDYILKKMEKQNWKKILICFFVIIGLFFGIDAGKDKIMRKDKLVIAGKLGTEPEILINIYKILIQENMNIDVELKSGFGKTSFVFNALKAGEIDIYPEFTGTAVFTFLEEQPVSNGAKAVYNQAKEGLMKKYGMVFLSSMKFNNTYALAVPRKFAEENNLMKISDLEKVKDKIKAGFTREFNDREDGYKGMKKLYGFELPDIKELEPKLRYIAVQSGDINLIDAYSTDSELEKYDLSVLEDDRNLFPPYQGAPLLKEKTLKKYPQLEEVLGKLKDRITDAEMRKMNYEVGVNNKRAEDVAKEYLKKSGLIK
ncbi:ABC transporter permease/substrate-binding protein [Leptotrichia sp. OH3620_COT-345]|uniref:ABC transporter permease/substrate-binding protein n=1 Tax=Leptotrichia sp. OH3620_COT-345 TaxID=2491048 RepID=UPI000F64604C|nr:ABC transporter permease/substrate-binding protein [Leptotrichia sp. OH3620_COT-345]RRD40015.1 ABC transporter permease/substrate-binding protein [Leptotrichia sp. OH3620_COT-345]